MTNHDFLCDYVNNPSGVRVHGHLLQIENELYNYSTLICTITGGVADFNCRKYSTTTTKIQNTLKRLLENNSFIINEYEGNYAYFWNYGCMGAENWTMNDLKQRGII